MIITEQTKKDIQEYLNKSNGCLILLGKKGLGKRILAETIAKKILNTDDLLQHPDFSVITSDKQIIKIEDLDEMKIKSSNHASAGSKKVFIIDDANLMTPAAQNSLLKLLEDNNRTNVIIFIAHGNLLSTIHSRCKIINVTAPSQGEFIEYLKNNEKSIDDLTFALSDCIPGTYFSLKLKEEYLSDIKKFFRAYEKGDLKEIYLVLALMKEKDKDSFFSRHEVDDVLLFLNLLLNVTGELLVQHYEDHFNNYSAFFNFEVAKKSYTPNQCIAMVNIIKEHIKRLEKKGAYSKNDFFDLFRSII